MISQSDYVDQQSFVEAHNNLAVEYNDDFVGIASYNIFVGIAVATIFGAAFFFDLFWPERHESRAVRMAWKICVVLACIMALADALALTVIVATHRVTITGVSALTAQTLYASDNKSGNPPLIYKKYGRAVASVVFLWPGFVATVASTVILFMSHAHDDKFGPKSAHAIREDEEKSGTRGTDMSSLPEQSAKGTDSSNDPYNNTRDPREDSPSFLASKTRDADLAAAGIR